MTNKREPGYYWVRIENSIYMAQWDKEYWWPFEYMNDSVYFEQVDEVISRITPSIKYTEEDMIGFARFINFIIPDYGFDVKAVFEDWLKQRKE